MSEYNTQPTIQTLLEEMQKGFAAIHEQFHEVWRRLDMIEAKIERSQRSALEHRGQIAAARQANHRA